MALAKHDPSYCEQCKWLWINVLFSGENCERCKASLEIYESDKIRMYVRCSNTNCARHVATAACENPVLQKRHPKYEEPPKPVIGTIEMRCPTCLISINLNDQAEPKMYDKLKLECGHWVTYGKHPVFMRKLATRLKEAEEKRKAKR